MILGLTGGIASGKSTVAAMLRERGVTVIDADLIAREVVEVGKPAYNGIVKHFGTGVLDDTGALNRKVLGEIIFSDREKRMVLNEIVHPEVRKEMRLQAILAQQRGERLVFMDIPLLYESRLSYMVDKVVVVYVPESVQFTRLMERDEFDEEQATKRLRAQMNIEEKRKVAHHVIDNQGSRTDTLKQVDDLVTSLLAETTP
ncbi:dephospho-CoA kinase [Brevibacterium sp. JNUCC-42]|uniref:Dephospho-CoA kinase n=1 Tax=Brevibacillus laterosporus TaxID=1465 RepID=A0A502INE5_BRELA|nr:dephospho-CoA kinase [Brevibacillus laterosporus]QOS97428.1 dephospho-CoA kinase [Brevibacterium sp. JNUCC-42]QDX92782.1 dephospho-CoA kinase [Brevibacillus laterosporus]RAP25704.1 Dephospho-CoA kinase [Brevibacillus laterosporus]TPG71093.1 dephospho-CoA kinase [Brevibacillus laterosporus]TPG87865.1 dephospho-CoA kinase [Brevibacillus laterosporus]